MKRIFYRLLFYVLCFTLYTSRSLADSTIKINEFQVDTSPQNIELFNLGSTPIDISGWYLDDSGGSSYYTISSNLTLEPNSCYVFSSDFNLNKSSADSVRLFDKSSPPITSSATLIDSFSYVSSHGAGNSYSRSTDGGSIWTTIPSSIGLYNVTDASCIFQITPTPALPTSVSIPTPPSTPTFIPTSTATPSFTVSNHQNVYVTEVFSSPQTGEAEWIELYNDNNFEVSLQNWYIDDELNAGSSPKLFSLTIASKSFNAITLSSSIFNNSGDSVRLLNAEKGEKDSFEFGVGTSNLSFGKIHFEGDEVCKQTPSKGTRNNPCSNVTPTSVNAKMTPQPSVTTKPTTTKPTTTKPKPTIKPTSDVLGVETENTKSSIKAVDVGTNSSLISIVFSILTIVSVFFKIKT